VHLGDQVVGVYGIGIGMPATEIRAGIGVHHRPGRGAEPVLYDLPGIRTRNRVHGVVAHAEPAGEKRPDGVEVKDGRHKLGVITDRVDNLDGGAL